MPEIDQYGKDYRRAFKLAVKDGLAEAKQAHNMKALSLREPHAILTVTVRDGLALKQIETRSWFTSYRGPLLIHASKRFSVEEVYLCTQEPFLSALLNAGYGLPSMLPRGAIIGKVMLVGCHIILPIPSRCFGNDYEVTLPPPEPEHSFGDYTPGRYAWVFEEPVQFENPIPFSGQLGLFNVPDEVVPHG